MLEILKKYLIKPFEGLAKKLGNGLIGPYICPAGYPTQGWGLLVANLAVPPITTQEAEARLDAAIPYYVDVAFTLSPSLVRATPEQIAAVVDFIFNLGALRYKASTLRKRVNEEDWDGACEEFMKWVYGGGKKLPGLVARRAAEVALIRRSLA
jgi:lysozyme